MYFIELILKKLTQKKEKPTYNPISGAMLDDYEACEHTFMPIDSTGEILSCTKCGVLSTKKEVRSKNFFMKGEDDRADNL
jgi:hypothetical protein